MWNGVLQGLQMSRNVRVRTDTMKKESILRWVPTDLEPGV